MSEYATLIFKTTGLMLGWIFLQVAQYEGLINKAFDQLFSLGLLVVIIIFLFKEYKSGKRYNAERDVSYQDLVKESIETRKDFNITIQKLSEAIDNLNRG